MSVRILVGIADGTKTAACLYDSVTGLVFGPLLDDEDHAERVIRHCENAFLMDARLCQNYDLRRAATAMKAENLVPEGEA